MAIAERHDHGILRLLFKSNNNEDFMNKLFLITAFSLAPLSALAGPMVGGGDNDVAFRCTTPTIDAHYKITGSVNVNSEEISLKVTLVRSTETDRGVLGSGEDKYFGKKFEIFLNTEKLEPIGYLLALEDTALLAKGDSIPVECVRLVTE